MTLMLTVAQLQEKYGEDIIFLFKGDEPYVESLGNPLGVLIERDDKVLCFECETWHEKLAGPPHMSHLKNAHSMTADEYKEKWGFNKGAPLCSRKVSESLREKSLDWDRQHPDKVKKRLSDLRRGHRTMMEQGYKPRLKKRAQALNSRNACAEQMKQRYRLLQAKFGRDVGLNQIRVSDPGIDGWAVRHYGSWNKFKEAMGEPILKGGPSSAKEEADLIYDLRQYIEEHNKLPWDVYTKKRKDNFPHSIEPYETKWGTLSNAYLVCGVNGGYFKNSKNKAEKYWYCEPEWAQQASDSEARLNARAIKLPEGSADQIEQTKRIIAEVALENRVRKTLKHQLA